MPLVREIVAAIDLIAPESTAFPWDNVGLLVGDPSAAVRKAVVSLDRSKAAVEFAIFHGAQAVISHHPLFFEPVRNLNGDFYDAAVASALLRSGIALITAHTNWDVAPGGINDALAQRIGLEAVEPFGAAGRIGRLPTPMPLDDFLRHVDVRLTTKSWAWGVSREVVHVAVCGGAADGEWRAAAAAGANVFVTGEVKQHVALEACESGLAAIAAGHYATEQPGMEALADRLAWAFPDTAWHLFEPDLGDAGRPW